MSTTPNSHRLFRALPTVGAIILCSAGALWGKTSLQPVRLQAFTERSDYFLCRKKIIDSLQKKATSQNVVQKLLAGCRDQFPGTSAFIECKKNAAQQYKSDRAQMLGAVSSCKSEYIKYSFDPQLPVPLYLGDKEAYFCGAGLNVIRRIELPPKSSDGTASTPEATASDSSSILLKPNNFGNFSCDPLVDTFQGKRPAEYVLVGNHPRLFAALGDFPLDKFRGILKIPPPAAPSSAKKKTPAPPDVPIITKAFGEIDHPFVDNDMSVFFPTAYCTFENRLGNLFDAIQLYYLVDQPHKLAMPYFGIAFYRQEAHLTTTAIAKKLGAALGPSYKRTDMGEGKHYFSQVPIAEFDDEGDPKNLCKEPRSHTYLAVIKETQRPSFKQYLLFANIRNLCNFGDMLAKRLVKN